MRFDLLRMPQLSARIIERLRCFERNVDNRIDKFERVAIQRFFVKIIGFIANGVAFAAFHSIIVTIEHLLEWPAIDHRLVARKTRAAAVVALDYLPWDDLEILRFVIDRTT